tara:strand:- start:404 stop:1108 length:705 start_codon:yes stop_codon:yes gene_type:complete
MALPKLNTQTFELNVPSTDEKVKYRPFLVKEEKVLLQAQQSEKPEEMADALVQVINNCTFNKINASLLPSFDIEYIFLKIRSKSVGEKVDLMITCPDDNETKVKHTVDLSKVEVEVDEEHNNTISLTDNVSVIMSYPTIKTFQGANLQSMNAEEIINLTGRCIYQIVDGVETYETKDLNSKDVDEFLENLTQDQFAKIQSFFTSMPRLKHEVKVTNPKTKKKGTVTLQGMQSFF